MSTSPTATASAAPQQLRRTLTLWHLIVYGIIVVQPVAPMPSFASSPRRRAACRHLHSDRDGGQLLTAFSYGRMARAYPSAGSAYTYVGRELHPALWIRLTGWSMTMDYILESIDLHHLVQQSRGKHPARGSLRRLGRPVRCAVHRNEPARREDERSHQRRPCRRNGCSDRYLLVAAIQVYFASTDHSLAYFTRPFYDPKTFSAPAVFTGTSIAVLTYIGFDGISTLSEEAEDPKKNISTPTVLVCLITGVLASVEVYAAQLVWPSSQFRTSTPLTFTSPDGSAVCFSFTW